MYIYKSTIVFCSWWKRKAYCNIKMAGCLGFIRQKANGW